MKNLIIAIFCLFTISAFSQTDKKVAVFNPEGSVMESLKSIVREEISNAIVNTRGYTVVERTMIDKVLAEAKFQSKGLVDDSQISELGRMMGADYVTYGSVVALGSNYYISLKMVDVVTAKVILQSTGSTQQGTNDLIQVTRSIANKLIASGQLNVQTSAPAAKPAVSTPVASGDECLLIAIRPNSDIPLARTVIDYITQKFAGKYPVKVATTVSSSPVSSLCARFRSQYNCKYIALITLKDLDKEVYYIAETLNAVNKKRVEGPVKKVLKKKQYSKMDIVKDIADNYNHLLW
ncbi:CsgG/HfaB family protein [Plebeiibacterium marinum]|uniref:CsgG/HfaB family protein n=1 Tax=Plebeiibacterium marinum TaxID=2992111 RepID=A0AAE3MI02_9BACT|nr:CsgG/HfaB family protein [Plebeiobacterium marinum]MCW3807899.1 CsgG/HfaB family protein [Plebeiobacterium marinum]